MNRLNQILVVILIIQIVLAGIVFWPRSFAPESGGGPLFANLAATEIAELTISDAEGKRIALAKRGSDWVLPDADDFPAQGDRITPFLEKLEALQTNRLVTQTDASHKRLKVAANDYERLIEFKLQGGDSYKLYVGSSAGAKATHIRADGDSNVYLTGDLTAWDTKAGAADWIDTLYFTIPMTAPLALTLENANGTFEFVKDGENWTMKGLADDEVFKESSLTALLNQATSVRMTAPIGKEEQAEFGLNDPQAVITLVTEDKTYTLRIGAKDKGGKGYVFASSESPYYVRVAEYTGNNFVNKNRADFLEPPPTPTIPPIPAPSSS